MLLLLRVLFSLCAVLACFFSLALGLCTPVCFVFTLNRSFYPTTSVHPVFVPVFYERLNVWCRKEEVDARGNVKLACAQSHADTAQKATSQLYEMFYAPGYACSLRPHKAIIQLTIHPFFVGYVALSTEFLSIALPTELLSRKADRLRVRSSVGSAL